MEEEQQHLDSTLSEVFKFKDEHKKKDTNASDDASVKGGIEKQHDVSNPASTQRQPIRKNPPGYKYFYNSIRDDIEKENPEVKTVAGLNLLISNIYYNELSEDEKKLFDELAVKDRKKHDDDAMESDASDAALHEALLLTSSTIPDDNNNNEEEFLNSKILPNHKDENSIPNNNAKNKNVLKTATKKYHSYDAFLSNDEINDEMVPRKNLSAFNLFSNYIRPILKEQFPELRCIEMSRKANLEFKKLSSEERKKWKDKAQQDKKRYKEEVKEYHKNKHLSASNAIVSEERNDTTMDYKGRNNRIYELFCQAMQLKIIIEYPFLSSKDVDKKIQHQFKNLSKDEQAYWESLEQDDFKILSAHERTYWDSLRQIKKQKLSSDKEVNEPDDPTTNDNDSSTTPKKRKCAHHKPRPPKKNLSSFMFFSNSIRDELRKKYPDKYNNTNTSTNNKDLCKMIRAEFKELESDQRKLFDELAEDDKKRYNDEMAKYVADDTETDSDDDCHLSALQLAMTLHSLSFPDHESATRTKRKRKRKGDKDEVDPLPKRYQSTFFQFLNSNREHLKKKYPEARMCQLTKHAGAEYTNLSTEERQIYVDKAAEDKKEYEQAMIDYKTKKKKQDIYAAALELASILLEYPEYSRFVSNDIEYIYDNLKV